MGILIFISYATDDVKVFQIPVIAEGLSKYPKIEDVLYWQEDMHDDMYAYMDENIGKCDLFILFCSPTALKSVPVAKEWRAAEALNKPIIPVFSSPEYIPPLLRPRLGLQIDVFNVQENIKKLYELILKKWIPKEDSDIPLQFTHKNKTEMVQADKKDHFITPILNFCMRNNLSIKNILLTTSAGTRIPDDQFDETVSSIYSKYGKEYLIEIERMQIVANFKVCIIGDPESGKSKLLQYCVEMSYNDDYKPTKGVDFWVKPFHYQSKDKNFNINLMFWDFGGSFDQYHSDVPKRVLFNESDGIFIVGDLTRKETFERIEKNCVPKIRKILGEIPIVLLANKCDLEYDIEESAIETMGRQLGIEKVFFTSAKTGQNVDAAFKSIIAPMIARQLKVL